MKIKLLTFLLGLSLAAYSTPQVPDLIIFKGDTIKLLQSNLMNGRNYNETVSYRISFNNPSNCWDGVYSIWSLKNNSLFLIETRECNTDEIIKKENKLAIWYSGKLYIPEGKKVYNDPYSGYPPSYEEEYEFQINEGKVKSEKILDNRKTTTSYLSSSKLDDLIFEKLNIEQLKKLRKEKSFFRAVFTVELNEDWTIDSVTFINFDTNSKFNFVTKDLVRETLKNIKDWDAIYLHGEPYEVPFTHSIYFDKKKLKNILLTLYSKS